MSLPCENTDDSNLENANTEKVEKPKVELTAAQKARIERNRQKALLLRQSRLSQQQLIDSKSKSACSRYINSVNSVFGNSQLFCVQPQIALVLHYGSNFCQKVTLSFRHSHKPRKVNCNMWSPQLIVFVICQ